MAVQFLRMYKGDDRTFPLQITADGVARDLTGATFALTAAYTPGGDPVLSLDDGAFTITSAENGEVSVAFAAADTAEVELPDPTWPGYYYGPWWGWPYTGPRPSGASWYRYRKLYFDVAVTIAGDVRTWPEDTNGTPRLGNLLIYAPASE